MSAAGTESGRKAEFTAVPAKVAQFAVLGSRRALTLEGKLDGTWLTKPLPVALLYLGLITLQESFTIANAVPNHIVVAVLLDATLLVLALTHAALVRRLAPPTSAMLVAFMPAGLIRIVSLTTPLREFTYIQWFAIIAIVIYAGIVTATKLLGSDLASLGLRWPAAKNLPLEVGIVLVGFALGFVEYQILRPGAITRGLDVREIVGPALVLLVATGLLEEIAFRGLLQRYATAAMGQTWGIAFVTATFAALHFGWVYATPWAWTDIFFVASVGLTYSLVRRKTGSIVGVTLSHGITNAMLFLVMPFIVIQYPWLVFGAGH